MISAMAFVTALGCGGRESGTSAGATSGGVGISSGAATGSSTGESSGSVADTTGDPVGDMGMNAPPQGSAGPAFTTGAAVAELRKML